MAKLLESVKQKVWGAGAELGARAASRALDALDTAARVRKAAPDRVKAAARRVPIVGKRLSRGEVVEAAAAVVEEVKATVKAPQRKAKQDATDRKQTARTQRLAAVDTKIEFEPVGPPAEYFKGRKVVGAGGRKTMPAAAAKSLRRKAQPHGFKAKRGQKKHR